MNMSIHRLKEIEALGISLEESLEYAFVKNNSFAITEAIREHGIDIIDNDEQDPEAALTYALDNLSETMLTIHLKAYGYQPIPKRKQVKREKALSH